MCPSARPYGLGYTGYGKIKQSPKKIKISRKLWLTSNFRSFYGHYLFHGVFCSLARRQMHFPWWIAGSVGQRCTRYEFWRSVSFPEVSFRKPRWPWNALFCPLHAEGNASDASGLGFVERLLIRRHSHCPRQRYTASVSGGSSLYLEVWVLN